MRNEPDAANLLETARTTLHDLVLPALAGIARYQGLMIANAIAIAARQIEAGDRPLAEARGRLAALYSSDADLPDLERRLVRDLRAGAFDVVSERRAAVWNHLWATACAAAAESSPKSLNGRPLITRNSSVSRHESP